MQPRSLINCGAVLRTRELVVGVRIGNFRIELDIVVDPGHVPRLDASAPHQNVGAS